MSPEPSTLALYETCLALLVAGCTGISVLTTFMAVAVYRRRAKSCDPVAVLVAWMLLRTEGVLLLVQCLFMSVAVDRLLAMHAPEPPDVWGRYVAYGTARTAASVLIAVKVVLTGRDHAKLRAMADAELPAPPPDAPNPV